LKAGDVGLTYELTVGFLFNARHFVILVKISRQSRTLAPVVRVAALTDALRGFEGGLFGVLSKWEIKYGRGKARG
jgi:hypothetical protein